MRKDFNSFDEAVDYYVVAERKVIDDIRLLQKRLEDVRILKAYNLRMKEAKQAKELENLRGDL
jgi:hypothetical protein